MSKLSDHDSWAEPARAGTDEKGRRLKLEVTGAGLAGALSLAAVQFPGFIWLFYVGAALSLILLMVICLELLPLHMLQRGWGRFSDTRVLERAAPGYLNVAAGYDEIETLYDQLLGQHWAPGRLDGYRGPRNVLVDAQRQLDRLPKRAQLVALNVHLVNTIEAFDHWLSMCEQALKTGVLTYRSEEAMLRINRLADQYAAFVERHNAVCADTNAQLRGMRLALVYPREVYLQRPDCVRTAPST